MSDGSLVSTPSLKERATVKTVEMEEHEAAPKSSALTHWFHFDASCFQYELWWILQFLQVFLGSMNCAVSVE